MGKNPALLIKHFPSSKKKGKRLMARKKNLRRGLKKMYFFMFQSEYFFHFFKAQRNLMGHQTPILILKRKSRRRGVFLFSFPL